MNADEEWSLAAFVSRAERLRALPIISGGGLSNSWSISFGQAKGLSITTTGPEEQALRSLLVDVRPFTMTKEPVHLGRVHNLLHRELTDSSLRDDLALIREEWKTEQRGMIGFITDDKQYKAIEIFDLWLNGVYFHDDRYKAEALNRLPLVMRSLSQTILHQVVVGAVRAIIGTAWIVVQAKRRKALA